MTVYILSESTSILVPENQRGYQTAVFPIGPLLFSYHRNLLPSFDYIYIKNQDVDNVNIFFYFY